MEAETVTKIDFIVSNFPTDFRLLQLVTQKYLQVLVDISKVQMGYVYDD